MQVFTLYSSVFIRFDDKAAVFYNTHNFASASFVSSAVVLDTCLYLSNIDNLNTIQIDENNACFCKQLCDLEFGAIHEKEDVIVSFPPSLVLKNDWDYVKSIQRESKTQVLEYLTRITLYLAGGKGINKKIFYQTEYPYPGDAIMDECQLVTFLDRVSKLPEIQVQYVFPFIEEYPGILKILEQIRKTQNRYKIIVRDKEYYGNPKAIEILKSAESNVIVINDARNLYLDQITDSVENRFLIFDDKSEANADDCIAKRGLLNCSFVAIYDGTNEKYIMNVSFPTENEILNGKYTRKHIFSHQVINTFNFGHLFISPKGNVYSDLMEKPIGSMQDSFYSLIISEMDNNYSWRRTRYLKQNCRQCHLVDFCPSISPVEKIMRSRCILR